MIKYVYNRESHTKVIKKTKNIYANKLTTNVDLMKSVHKKAKIKTNKVLKKNKHLTV